MAKMAAQAGGAGIEYSRPFCSPQNGGMVYEGLCQTQKGQGAEPPEKISAKSHSFIHQCQWAGFSHPHFWSGK
ncbi:MAG: hypothetical protein U0V54_10855 [Saprospiraceae bacterium]